MRLTDLGKFNTFTELNAAHPDKEYKSGDYVTVDGTLYYWQPISESWGLTYPIEEEVTNEIDLSTQTEVAPKETDLSSSAEETPPEKDLSSVAEDEGRNNHDHDENVTMENNLTVANDTRTRRLFADWAFISGLLRAGGLRVDGIISADSIIADNITGLDDAINGIVTDMFIRKDRPDRTLNLVQFLAGLEYGLYASGSKNGGKLHDSGLAELGKLQVNGDSEFRGNLSSKDFVSGFTAGKGWAIRLKKYLNAAGVEETRTVAEFDDLIIRGTMRVFEFIASQMLGENDNRTFTGMMEVDHYDPETGKVWLDTQDGKLYNTFRKDDIILVQQFNGIPAEDKSYYLTKQYELIITEVGVGDMSQKEDRLDWVKFKNFTTTMEGDMKDIITKGDTFVRIDNLTDSRRKGIIQVMTVGEDTPYMDVIYAKKTDPDNALKGRMGNLQGIYHHLFGWLQDFGEYLINLYAVGDFRLRQTGESLDSKIEMLKGVFSTSYQRVTYELTEEDNYLTNATFTESMEGWTAENEASIITQNNGPLLMNGNIFNITGKLAVIEEYEGRNMLHIHNSYVRQSNSFIKQPGTHKEYKQPSQETTDEFVEVKDTLYLSIKFLAKTSGNLTLGIRSAATDIDSLPYVELEIDSSYDWQIMQWSGTWDGKGDFLLQYTGDMYVSVLSLTDKPLDDFKKHVSTQIEQTASNIRLLGTNINNVKSTVTRLGIDLDAANERISLYANKVDNINNTVTNLGIRLDAAESSISLYATKVGNNEAAISALQIKTDSIISTVASVQGNLEEAKKIAAAASQAAMDKAIQGVNDANDAWWKAYYAQQDADRAHSMAVSNATAIAQTDSAVSVLAGRFQSDGTLVNTGGLLVTADKTELYNEIYDINGKLAKKAEISTSVQYDPVTMNVTTAIKLTADKIDLNGVTTINNSFRVEKNGTTHIGGFTVDSGRLHWKQNGYFGDDSRSLKLGVSQSEYEGIVDVAFNASTKGRFGVKAVGSNIGGASVYASTGSLIYPASGMTYAGFFVGAVDVRDTNSGIISDVCASKSFRVITSRNANGTYYYHEGVNWNKTVGSPDLDHIRLIVEGGIITGYYGE